MDRRKFIQTGIAGVAGLSLVRTGLANIQMTVPSDISVDRVKLGKTGLKVSRIAMGTGTKGWNYQSNQTRLGLDNFVKIARHGYERGIRFFDMADMYGSQPFVGKALKELPCQNKSAGIPAFQLPGESDSFFGPGYHPVAIFRPPTRQPGIALAGGKDHRRRLRVGHHPLLRLLPRQQGQICGKYSRPLRSSI